MAALAENLPLLAGLVVSLGVAYVAWGNRPSRGSYTLVGIMLAVSVWELSHLLVHATSGPIEAGFERLRWTGVSFIAFAWLAFILDYTGRDGFLTRRGVAALFAWPAALTALVWVGDPLGLPSVWHSLDAETGAVYWTHVAVSYGLLGVGTGLLVLETRRADSLFRRQSLALLAGVTVPWIGSAVSVFELLGDLHLHAMPLGFTLGGAVLLWATTRTGVTDIAPVARSTIVRTLSAGVVAVDRGGRVVEVNPAARRLLGLDDDAVGRALEEALVDHPEVAERCRAMERGVREVDVETGDGGRTVQLQASPLYDRRDRPVGRLFLLRDVTERRQRERALERRNERLDEFAGVVSHDLRSPLGVASGYLELGRERVDEEVEAFDRVADALDRMEEIIEGLLLVARRGDVIEDPAPVSLDAVARRAWESVETPGAELVVAVDGEIEADEERLRRALENLFRNAVEHAEPEVTVTVGAFDGGFFVEDDGPGVPAGAAEDVFALGYSTAEGGTGFGLGIVRRICEAHGWEVSATEASGGGARFEVEGVVGIEASPAGHRE